jgi:hypothetical protein
MTFASAAWKQLPEEDKAKFNAWAGVTQQTVDEAIQANNKRPDNILGLFKVGAASCVGCLLAGWLKICYHRTT